MAASRITSETHLVQSAGGGKVRLTNDKWITEIDARVPRATVAAMMRAIAGSGWSCRVDVTNAGARFRTLLPHADAAPVLAVVGL